MTYYISKTVNKPFDTVVADVTARLKEQGFGLLTDIDVQVTLNMYVASAAAGNAGPVSVTSPQLPQQRATAAEMEANGGRASTVVSALAAISGVWDDALP